jgi:hypothetical protein
MCVLRSSSLRQLLEIVGLKFAEITPIDAAHAAEYDLAPALMVDENIMS